VRLWLYGVGAVVAGGVALALLSPKVKPPLASKIRVGSLFRANVRSQYFDGDEVCMRATAITSAGIYARIGDPRYPGIALEVLILPRDVTAVADPAASSCAPPSSTAWMLLEGSPVMLRKGLRYRGCIVVPTLIPNALVRPRLRPGLEARGFSDVAIAESKPDDWPAVACDFFVEATWDRDDQEFDRPGAVAFAWRSA
jgi:hypothetical protein